MLQQKKLVEISEKNFDEIFLKFILVGDPGVGKTSLLSQYVDNKFSHTYNATIGVEFGSKSVELKDSKLRLQIWDTTGQQSFSAVTKSFYRNAHCIFLIYDIQNRESFLNLDEWLREVMDHADSESILVLIGNKMDTNNKNKREVEYKEGVEFMKEKNCHFFFETSAAQGNNVELAFMEAAKLAYLSWTQENNNATERISIFRKERKSIKLSVGRYSGQMLPVREKDICAC